MDPVVSVVLMECLSPWKWGVWNSNLFVGELVSPSVIQGDVRGHNPKLCCWCCSNRA
ncbi:hypothetical protein NPIL_443481, partial [Nephila pilipes]